MAELVTDVFPALALALEPSSPDAMKRPPRDPKEPLVGWAFFGLIVWQGAVLAGMTLLAFRVALDWYGVEGRQAVTVAFTTLAFAQVFHTFNARSQRRSAFDTRLFTNGWLWGALLMCATLQLAAVCSPLLQRVLHTAPLGAADWALIVGSSMAPVAVVEIVKGVDRRPE